MKSDNLHLNDINKKVMPYKSTYIKIVISFFLSIVLFIAINSCADLSSGPDEQNNQTETTITINAPSSNSQITEGSNEVSYSLTKPYSIKFLELYVDGNFIKNYPPNSDGTQPKIIFSLDSSFVGRKINLNIIYYDNNGSSKKSNEIVNLLVTINDLPPTPPYNLQIINFRDGSINLSWKDSSRYIEKYEIWRKIGSGNPYVLHLEVAGNSNNVNDNGLDQNLIYFYKIRGVKTKGSSPFSSEVNSEGVFTSGNLEPPTQLIATPIGMWTVQLQWKDNSDNENFFAVERRGEYSNFARVATLSKNTSAYKDSGNGLFAGGKFYYRIKSFSNSDSAISNTSSVQTFLYNFSAPNNLTGTYNSTAKVIQLNWTKIDDRTVFFDIEKKSVDVDFQLLKRINAASITYLDFDIITNKIYTYRVRGYDLTYFSAYSNELIILTN
jgi:hypothetical protein